MKRAAIRPARGFPKDPQVKTANDAGATIIYEKDPESAVKAIRAKLEGGVLGVVGYRSLHSSKKEVLRLLDTLHDKGCAAQDCATGRRSDGRHANALMAEFDRDIRHERAGGLEFAEKAGAKGGRKAARNGAAKRLPKDQALRIWKDLTIPTNALAVDRINEQGYSLPWGAGALRNQFGASGRPQGRRSTV